MSKKAIKKASRITVDEIALVATTGVARALATRQAAGIELNSEELSQVSGGLAQSAIIVGPIIDGLLPAPKLPTM